METEPQKIDIWLHDLSHVMISNTKLGLYVEVYAPGTLRDGHGLLLKGSALVPETTATKLREILTAGN